MIEGKDHPELIPDLTAYRQYLAAISQHAVATATDIEKRSTAAHINLIHLSDQDNQALLTVLQTFHERYTKFIQDFNNEAQAKGQSFDPQPLLRERDLLIQATHDSLRSVLTANGWIALDEHVRGQKEHMRIPFAEGVK
jgi:hypothetical protein